jgi:ribonuclease P protein component
LTVFYVPRSSGTGDPGTGVRVGFTVSKALGGAVERNRMKRRLREAVRLQGISPGPDADIVINPKRTLLAAEFSELRNELAKAFVVVGRALQKEKR